MKSNHNSSSHEPKDYQVVFNILKEQIEIKPQQTAIANGGVGVVFNILKEQIEIKPQQ